VLDAYERSARGVGSGTREGAPDEDALNKLLARGRRLLGQKYRASDTARGRRRPLSPFFRFPSWSALFASDAPKRLHAYRLVVR